MTNDAGSQTRTVEGREWARVLRELRQVVERARVPRVRHIGGMVIIPCPNARWPRLTEEEHVRATLD